MPKIKLFKHFTITAFIFAILFSFCVFQQNVFADSSNVVETNLFGNVKDDGGGCGVYTILNLVVDILSIGIGILALIGITIVGIKYLTAKGNTEQTIKAKKRMFEVVIGLVAYAMLYAGVQFLLPGGHFNNSSCSTISDVELANTKAKEKAEIAKSSKTESSNDSKKSGGTDDDIKSAACKGSSSTKTKKAKGTGYSSTIKLCEKKFKLFTQGNSAWKGDKFGHNVNDLDCTIGGCGCGANSLAIILSGYGLNQNTRSVAKGLIKTAKSNGYTDPTSKYTMGKYLKSIGFKSKKHDNDEGYKKTYKEMRKALMAGHQLVVYVGDGGNKSSWSKFTSSGAHFICVLGIDPSNNKVFVGNPTGSGKKGWYKLSDVAKAVHSNQFWLEVYK